MSAMMTSLLAAVVGSGFLPGPHSDEWPQWRGPSRDGQVHGPAWPEKLTGRLRLTWRVEGLGPSYSGPVVTESIVFTTETRDEATEVVTAYDRDSGRLIWQREWPGAMKVPFFANRNGSWIRSTPAFDGERLFVAGMRDVLVCLNGADGREIWRVDFVERYGTPLPDFGFVCSPLVVGDHVYVQAGAAFCKIDKRTGETTWRTLVDSGGMNGSAFSSPILATLHERDQLIVLTRTHMHGVDPESGRALWSAPIRAFRGMNILTPLVTGDAVFTATYGGRARLLELEPDGDALTVNTRWDRGMQGYMTSPVIVGEYVYFFTRSNRFTCLRLSDGERMWISPPTGDDYWSLAANGDRILALSNNGVLRLIRANRDAYEVIDEMEISSAETWAHVTVAGKNIVIREQDALSVWAWE